jgi:hypothetical protein
MLQAAKQEVEASKEANKSAAGSAASGVLNSATTAMGHAAGWIGAKLTGEGSATQSTVCARLCPCLAIVGLAHSSVTDTPRQVDP